MQKELNTLWYDVHKYSFDQLMSMAEKHLNKICYYFTKIMDVESATKKIAEVICTPLYIDRQITRNETKALSTLFPKMANINEKEVAVFISRSAIISKYTYLDYINTLPTEVRYHIAYVTICILGADANLEMSEYEIVNQLINRIF